MERIKFLQRRRRGPDIYSCVDWSMGLNEKKLTCAMWAAPFCAIYHKVVKFSKRHDKALSTCSKPPKLQSSDVQFPFLPLFIHFRANAPLQVMVGSHRIRCGPLSRIIHTTRRQEKEPYGHNWIRPRTSESSS